jgi:hypothetical protein
MAFVGLLSPGGLIFDGHTSMQGDPSMPDFLLILDAKLVTDQYYPRIGNT